MTKAALKVFQDFNFKSVRCDNEVYVPLFINRVGLAHTDVSLRISLSDQFIDYGF